MRASGWIGPLLLAGCAHGGDGAIGPPARELEAEARATVADVERLRGLRFERAVEVSALGRARFLTAYDARDTVDKQEEARQSAVWAAFGFAPGEAGAIEAGEHREDVVGFYHRLRRALLLRRDHAGDRRSRRSSISHELTHALQHQRFGDLAAAAPGDVDATLARRALLEGDAALVAFADGSERHGIAFRTLLARLVERLKEGKTEELARQGAHGWSAARRVTLFPYIEGLAFAGELYRAGGFALLDQVYAHPPTTTAQVMHPARYIAGDQPAEVREPAVPAGMRLVARGRLGELHTSLLLARCLPAGLARVRAAGWAGDAYAVVEGAPGKLAVLWSTTWDSEVDAYHFAFAIKTPRCWSTSTDGGETLRVVHRGHHVALVRGLADSEERLDAIARPLLDLPRARPPRRPPLAVAALVDRDRSDGVVEQGVYRSARLNLTAPIPAGFTDKSSTTAELHVERGHGNFAAISFVPLPPRKDPRLPDKAGEGWRIESARDVTLAVGAGREVRLTRDVRGATAATPTTTVQSRIMHAGICDGRATLLLLAVWSDADAGAKLERWFEELRPTAKAAGKTYVCGDL